MCTRKASKASGSSTSITYYSFCRGWDEQSNHLRFVVSAITFCESCIIQKDVRHRWIESSAAIERVEAESAKQRCPSPEASLIACQSLVTVIWTHIRFSQHSNVASAPNPPIRRSGCRYEWSQWSGACEHTCHVSTTIELPQQRTINSVTIAINSQLLNERYIQFSILPLALLHYPRFVHLL